MPTLARLWLGDLSRVGLQQIDRSSGAPPKEPPSYYPKTEPLLADIHPIKLEGSREVLWLKMNGRRSERGYRSAEVLGEPLKTDAAILVAVTALEAGELEAEGLPDDLVDHVIDFSKGWSEPPGEEDEASDEDIIQALVEGAAAGGYEPHEVIHDDQQVRTQFALQYVVALLRHYRPAFDSLAREEQRRLVKDGCKRVTTFLKALRQLMAFLEYGIPERDLRPKVEDAAGVIEAAELQDVEGLSSVKLGEALGIAAPPSDGSKRTNSTASAMAKRGRKLLQDNLGEDAWRASVKAKKEERDRFLSLEDEERHLVWLAENEGISVEQARRLVDELRGQ